MNRIYPIAIAVALSSVACAHAPKAYTFAYEQPKYAVDAVVKRRRPPAACSRP